VTTPDPIAVLRLEPGWWLDLGGTTVLTTSAPGRAGTVGAADLVLGTGTSPPDGLAVETLDGAYVLRFDGTAIGVGRAAALADVPDLDLALLDAGAAVGALRARFAIPSDAPGVGGPRGIALAPGEVATFTGRGEEFFVYSVEPWPGGAADRWGWLRRF